MQEIKSLENSDVVLENKEAKQTQVHGEENIDINQFIKIDCETKIEYTVNNLTDKISNSTRKQVKARLFICQCGKSYTTYQGLYSHKKIHNH
jgi:hypothetical protein